MMTFEIWAADYTVLTVQAEAALLSQVKIVRLSYIWVFSWEAHYNVLSLYEFATTYVANN